MVSGHLGYPLKPKGFKISSLKLDASRKMVRIELTYCAASN